LCLKGWNVPNSAILFYLQSYFSDENDLEFGQQLHFIPDHKLTRSLAEQIVGVFFAIKYLFKLVFILLRICEFADLLPDSESS